MNKNNNNRLHFLVGSFVLLLQAACTETRADKKPSQPTEPAPADAPSALTIAHEAYLAGDYVEMGERLKDVIVDPRSGELAKDNAFALLDSAYAATAGKLPARAPLPKGINTITFGVLNGGNGWGVNRRVYLMVRVEEGRGAHVKEIRLTRLPNETILSLAEKRGTLKIEPSTKGLEDVKIDLKDQEVLPERGAFSIQVQFDDGAPGIDAFVLGNKLVAGGQPELISPNVGEVLTTSHPEISWLPYRSPQYSSWETRVMYLSVTAKDKVVWDFFKWQPGDLAALKVGDPPGSTPAALAPDSYWVGLHCAEERTFGNIRIARSSDAGRPFTIAR